MNTKQKMLDDAIWLDWTTHDEDGFVNGIREDAPEEAKQAYQKHLAEKAKHRLTGTKV